VNGRSVAMLVDTGSSVTIVIDAVTTGCEMSPVGAVTVSSATGDSVKIIGKCNLNFEIGSGMRSKFNVYVAKCFLCKCTLGLDILKKISCFIDVANEFVYINDECISFKTEECEKSEHVQDDCHYKNFNGIEINESDERK
jgi:predicted aspartyl protease